VRVVIRRTYVRGRHEGEVIFTFVAPVCVRERESIEPRARCHQTHLRAYYSAHGSLEPYTKAVLRKRALYIRKRALYIRKRALYIRTQALSRGRHECEVI